ncbi:Protein STPG4 [Schistosoma japonicum]|nr:Protein STPG4 [Schistosoma japonicum]
MELIKQNYSTLTLKQKCTNSINSLDKKLIKFNNQSINNERINKKWTIKSLLKKSKPKSEWDKYAVVDRGNWFKSQMTYSPSPTRYHIKHSAIERPVTSSFKNTGRLKQYPMFTNDGLWLLPGAYDVSGVDEKLNQCHRTYSFKNMPRKFNDLLFGLHDKNLCLAPGQYNPYNEDFNRSTQTPTYNNVFKSKYPRSILNQKVDNIPPPGAYNLSTKDTFGITSPFVSQVPRFKRSKSFVPGPGTYNVNGEIQSVEELKRMGTHCGLFFRDYIDEV